MSVSLQGMFLISADHTIWEEERWGLMFSLLYSDNDSTTTKQRHRVKRITSFWIEKSNISLHYLYAQIAFVIVWFKSCHISCSHVWPLTSNLVCNVMMWHIWIWMIFESYANGIQPKSVHSLQQTHMNSEDLKYTIPFTSLRSVGPQKNKQVNTFI